MVRLFLFLPLLTVQSRRVALAVVLLALRCRRTRYCHASRVLQMPTWNAKLQNALRCSFACVRQVFRFVPCRTGRAITCVRLRSRCVRYWYVASACRVRTAAPRVRPRTSACAQHQGAARHEFCTRHRSQVSCHSVVLLRLAILQLRAGAMLVPA